MKTLSKMVVFKIVGFLELHEPGKKKKKEASGAEAPISTTVIQSEQIHTFVLLYWSFTAKIKSKP